MMRRPCPLAALAATVALLLVGPASGEEGKPPSSQPANRIAATADGGIEWTCLPGNEPKTFTLSTPAGQACLVQDAQGATLTLAGRKLMHVRGTVRIRTGKQGVLTALIAIHAKKVNVGITGDNGKTEEYALAPGTTIPVK